MRKLYIQSLTLIIALLISSFSYAQNSKTQLDEAKETTIGFMKAEGVKALENNLVKALGAERNSGAVTAAMKKFWKSAKGMDKQQATKLFHRFLNASESSLKKIASMSPSQLSSYVRDVTSNMKVDVKTLKKIIYGTGDKAGNAVLKTLSEMDDIIAKTGKLPKHILKAMRDEASGLNPKQARAFYDLLKEKMSKDLTNIGDLKTPGKGPGGMVGTVVDGVFVLFDAYDIYNSDEDPEVKGIKATAKIIDYGASTGAGVASAALGGGLGPGLVIAFTANRVSTLYTEMAMLKKEQQDIADTEENQKIDNGIFARSQLVKTSQLIKLGQLKEARFKLSKLRKFLGKNKFNNVTMLSNLRYKLEEKLNKAKYNERVNKEINKARKPFINASNYYKKGVELNIARSQANNALKMLQNSAKSYPEINEQQAIPRAKSLIAAINKKINEAEVLTITKVTLPKGEVYAGGTFDILITVSGGIPFHRAIGAISGNTSNNNVITMYWHAPSKPGKQNFTFTIGDCMGKTASVSKSIEVVENLGEDIEEEIVLDEIERNSPLDGLWEINLNSDVINSRSNSETSQAVYKVTKFKELNKDTEGMWGRGTSNIAKDVVLKFFNSKKIYFKKIKDLEHGFSYFYLYKYDEDTFENVVIKEIDNSNFEIFPISKYAPNYCIKLSVKGNYIECSIEDTGTTYLSSFKYKLFRKNTPSNPPTLTNGEWDWDELEDDFKYELNIYSKLSSAEKNNFNLSKIEEDEDAYETIQWKIAVFKKFQSEFKNSISSFKGKIPSTIKKEDLIWKLVDVELVNLGPSRPYSVTSSEIDGWVRIWKERVETEQGENYIAPLNSEEDPNTKRTKTIVSEFSWNLPQNQYQIGLKWNTNFQISGNLKASIQTLDDYKVIPNNSIEFNSDKDSKEVILEGKYFYIINESYEDYEEFRMVYKFELHLK